MVPMNQRSRASKAGFKVWESSMGLPKVALDSIVQPCAAQMRAKRAFWVECLINLITQPLATVPL